MRQRSFKLVAVFALWFICFELCGAAITLTQNSPLNFGTVLVNTSGGNGTISTAGVFSSTTLRATGITAGNITFQDTTILSVGLDLLVNFSITTPTVTLTGPSSGVTITGFTLSPTGITLVLLAPNSANVAIGGTLNVPAGTLAGTYTGTATFQSAGTLSGTNTANLSISVIIGQPITITQTQGMNFATLISNASTQTVVLTPAGVLSGAASPSGVPHAGAFNVTGQSSQTVTITLPSSFTLTSGANQMTVSNLTSTPAAGAATALSATGTATVNVGGTLTVSPNQPQGAYSGSYTITVNY